MLRIAIPAVMMLAASVMAAQFIEQATNRHAATPAAPAASLAPVAAVAAAPASTGSRRLVIRAGQGGHFAVDGRIDGRLIGFMVDTGASHIALRASDAARLGFHPWPRDYSTKIRTANGEGHAALVQLGTVEIGDIVVRDLPALVSPDEALGVNLLGMSFLSRVRWSHDHGSLIIEQ
jgi:aspartyl protease family protein